MCVKFSLIKEYIQKLISLIYKNLLSIDLSTLNEYHPLYTALLTLKMRKKKNNKIKKANLLRFY